MTFSRQNKIHYIACNILPVILRASCRTKKGLRVINIGFYGEKITERTIQPTFVPLCFRVRYFASFVVSRLS